MLDRNVQNRVSERLLDVGRQIIALASEISMSESSGSQSGLSNEQGTPFITLDGQTEPMVINAEAAQKSSRQAKAPLPDARLLRRILKQRSMRKDFFGLSLFADPAWDMLLDLAAARVEHKRVSVTSLCIASGVASTTALRWIAELNDAGLLVRTEDDVDRRRVFVSLSDKGAVILANYFARIGGPMSGI